MYSIRLLHCKSSLGNVKVAWEMLKFRICLHKYLEIVFFKTKQEWHFPIFVIKSLASLSGNVILWNPNSSAPYIKNSSSTYQ